MIRKDGCWYQLRSSSDRESGSIPDFSISSDSMSKMCISELARQIGYTYSTQLSLSVKNSSSGRQSVRRAVTGSTLRCLGLSHPEIASTSMCLKEAAHPPAYPSFWTRSSVRTEYRASNGRCVMSQFSRVDYLSHVCS